jgi:hypothetical protein
LWLPEGVKDAALLAVEEYHRMIIVKQKDFISRSPLDPRCGA